MRTRGTLLTLVVAFLAVGARVEAQRLIRIASTNTSDQFLESFDGLKKRTEELRYSLAVNLNSARRIGLEVPRDIISRADEVIE